MKRRRLDTRLDWRDIEMPVLRPFEDGIYPVTPEEEQAWCQDKMKRSPMPDYNDDPTYTLRIYKPKTYLRKKK